VGDAYTPVCASVPSLDSSTEGKSWAKVRLGDRYGENGKARFPGLFQ
jgi:hypothetical protein